MSGPAPGRQIEFFTHKNPGTVQLKAIEMQLKKKFVLGDIPPVITFHYFPTAVNSGDPSAIRSSVSNTMGSGPAQIAILEFNLGNSGGGPSFDNAFFQSMPKFAFVLFHNSTACDDFALTADNAINLKSGSGAITPQVVDRCLKIISI